MRARHALLAILLVPAAGCSGDRAALLCEAASRGDDAAIETLLTSAKADPNAKTSSGLTPLLCAAREGRLSTVEILLKAGADPNVAGPEGLTPLFAAATLGHLDTLRALLRAGANIEATFGERADTPLVGAVAEGQGMIVDALIQAGADVEHPSKEGITPLIVAAMVGNMEALRLLLAAKADPNRASSSNETALWAAVQSKRTNAVVSLATRKGPGFSHEHGTTPG